MSFVGPTDDEIQERVNSLVREVDIETTPVKKFITMLSQEFHIDLKPRRDFIKMALGEAISAMHEGGDDDDEESEEEESEEEESDEEEEVAAPVKKRKGGGGGLAAEKEISDKLAKFLKKGKKMSRTQIVKSLWEYIREHDLQNPSNKREIFLDDAMRKVFGCGKFTMFTMNKYIGEHIHPFKKADFTKNSTTPKKRKASASSSSSGKKGAKKRKPMNQPLYRLSDELQVIVGESVLSRPQVVSKLWDYIKAKELQNPSDRRQIICDDKLKAVMKKGKVTMFNMNQCITPHILERVERAAEVGDVGVADSDSE